MFVQIVDKQRRAVSVVKTALLGVGVSGRSVCVMANSWLDNYGRREEYAVFVSSPNDQEPFYEQGLTLVEAVGKMIASIKGRANGTNPGSQINSENQTELAPF